MQMEERQTGDCVICGALTIGVFTFKDWNPPEGVFCCQTCWQSGRMNKWLEPFNEAASRGLAFEINGRGPVELRQEMIDFFVQDSRIQDGICPNGCARLQPIDGDESGARCPVCGFEHYTRCL